MDVEVRTIVGSWFVRVDPKAIDERAGAAARDVRRRIQEGEAILATSPGEADDQSMLGRASTVQVILNPGHVVAVIEHPRSNRPL